MGTIASHYEALGIPVTASMAEIKVAFRRLARQLHPDTNPLNSAAEESFKRLNEAYQVLSHPDRRSRYDQTGQAQPVLLTSKSASYELGRILHRGDIADLYEARTAEARQRIIVKLVRCAADNDLMETEARVLRAIRPPRLPEESHHRYFPRLIDTLKVESGGALRRASVLPFLSGFHSLEAVRGAFPAGLPLEHGVWMFNRILEALDVLHSRYGLVHGALVPPHVLVHSGSTPRDPMTHAGMLVGWSSAVGIGDRVGVVVPRLERFYAPEILRKEPVTPETDIYMAARCALFVLGIDPETETRPAHVPEYLARFLRGCAVPSQRARPGDAWALHEELEAHLARHFGPKRYVPFDMPFRA